MRYPSLSRQTVERIADAVAFDRKLSSAAEQRVADHLHLLVVTRTYALRRQFTCPRISERRVLKAWLELKDAYGSKGIQVLADRILERQRTHYLVHDR